MQEVGKISAVYPVLPAIKTPVGGNNTQQQSSVSVPDFYNTAAVPSVISKTQYAELILENFEKAALDGKKISFTEEIAKQVQEGLEEIKTKASFLPAGKEREIYALRDKYYSIGQKMQFLKEISQFQGEFQVSSPQDCTNLNSLHNKILEEAKKRAFLGCQLHKDLITAAGGLPIQDVINSAQGHKVGQGGRCCVYEIPNTNYVLRAPNGAKINISPNAVFKYEYDFSPKAKVNHVMASIEDGRIRYEILENLKGLKKNIKNAQHPNYAKIIANMPQSAYDDYLAQIKSAAGAGLVQDFGGENLFIDVKNGRFLPFDYETAWVNETTQFTKPNAMGEIQTEPVTNMAYTLLNLGKAEEDDIAKIKGKILKAAAADTKDPDKTFLDFEDKIYRDFAPKEILGAFREIQSLKAERNWDGFQSALSSFCRQVDRILIKDTQDLGIDTLLALQEEVENN